MLGRTVETYIGETADPNDDLCFWTYIICVAPHAPGTKYHLIRVDNVVEKMERLGCELSLRQCRKIVKEHDSDTVKL